ncbi:MAG TPA: hypothetical protein VFK05_26685 [Polyangiaceae bacterium]|nr:hypothetical protein [Polyangiaceae bacterium]
MSSSRFAVFGLCLAFAACGEKFVASEGGGSGGSANAGHAGDSSAGVAASPGGSNQSSAGAADAGDGGDLNGEGGTPNGGGGAHQDGGAGGPLGKAGGSNAGGAGAGGALLEPSLPQAGLLVWLRADLGVQQNQGRVQAWQDQSGNQANAIQATVSARPKYLASGFNGKPTLEFDGQGQFLKFAEGFADFSNGLTGLIVAKPTKSDCDIMVEFSNGSEIDDIAFGAAQDQWMYEVSTSNLETGSVDRDLFALYTVIHRQSGTSDLRINGSALSTTEMPLPIVPESQLRLNNFVGHSLYGGECAYFQGQISEIILYSRALTNVELIAIEKYMDAHWALSTQGAPLP